MKFNFTLSLLVFALIASFTSQSLVDLADTLLVLTALFLVFKSKDWGSFFKSFKPSLLWIIWLIVVLIGLVVNMGFSNPEMWISFIEFKWILTLLSVVYLVRNLDSGSVKDKRVKLNVSDKLFNAYINSLIFLNSIALFLVFYRNNERRASGIFDAVMAFSHNIGPILCLFSVVLLLDWFKISRPQKYKISFVVLTSGILTLLTYTRGVWIGSAAAILICLFLWNYKKAILAFVALAVLAVVLIFTNQNIYNRVFAKTNAETQSNSERIALWKANLRMVQDYPLLGVGYGQNKNHVRHYFDEMGYPSGQLEAHAHNQYLQMWAGTGTLGLLCYLYFLFSILRTTLSGYKAAGEEKKAILLGLISALLCFMIGALTEANFNISKNRFLFLLLAGLAIGLSQQASKTVKE